VVDAIEAIAGRRNATAAQIAIAWLMARKPWIVPIPGTTKLHRLEENIAAADITFTSEELAEIDAVFSGIEVHGDRYSATSAARVTP
jgi:aryl-alcohol dehydrogenase-like predicted oxidoreductase